METEMKHIGHRMTAVKVSNGYEDVYYTILSTFVQFEIFLNKKLNFFL